MTDTDGNPKVNLTLEDIDKAAQFYEDLIDSIVKSPSKDTVALLTDAMDALDGLGAIRDYLVHPQEDDAEGDDASNNK